MKFWRGLPRVKSYRVSQFPLPEEYFYSQSSLVELYSPERIKPFKMNKFLPYLQLLIMRKAAAMGLFCNIFICVEQGTQFAIKPCFGYHIIHT